MPITEIELSTILQEKFPDAKIVIKDLAGDNDHYAVEIISSVFTGKNKLLQHRMVNDALKGCVGVTLHALSIKTTLKEQ